MTDEAPATLNPSIVHLTFADHVRALAAPRRWILHAWNAAEDQGEEPHVTAALPLPEGVSLEMHLAVAGAAVGRWRVALAPLTSDQKARHRLDRLQRLGPVMGVVDITEQIVAQARATRGGGGGERRQAERAKPAVSASVAAVQEAAAMQKAENERLQAELEGRRLRNELHKLERPSIDNPSPSGGGLLAMLAPFAPMAMEWVRTWLENQKQQTRALLEAVQREPVYVPPPSPPGLTIETLLQLVPQVRELGKLVGTLGGAAAGGSDDDAPASETLRMLEAVKDILGGLRTTEPTDQPATLPAPAAAPRKLDPQQMMSLRVTQFLMAVFAEQSATADPQHAADRLFERIGALPERFRLLLAQSQNVDQLLTGLPEWLPANLRQSVPNEIRQNPARRQWLETFLRTVHDIAAGRGADDDPEA
jgi:hypothetical protein